MQIQIDSKSILNVFDCWKFVRCRCCGGGANCFWCRLILMSWWFCVHVCVWRWHMLIDNQTIIVVVYICNKESNKDQKKRFQTLKQTGTIYLWFVSLIFLAAWKSKKNNKNQKQHPTSNVNFRCEWEKKQSNSKTKILIKCRLFSTFKWMKIEFNFFLWICVQISK